MQDTVNSSVVTVRVVGMSLVGGLLAMLASGCGTGDSTDAVAEAGTAAGPPPSFVRVAVIERRQIPPRVVAVGSVTPRWMSLVASGAEGLVENCHVEEGQFVAKGDVLSTLRMKSTDLRIKEAKAVLLEREHELAELEAGSRPQEIAEAKARMLAAEAVMKNTASKLRRSQRLYEQKAVGREELEDAREKAAAAEQTYQAARAVFERIEAGPRSEQVQQARARYEAQHERVAYLDEEKEKRTTRAPFDGYVVKLRTFVGQWLAKGGPVLVLAMLDEVDVVVNVDQWHLNNIRLGQPASIRVKGSQQTDWSGNVVAIVPRSEWESGSRGFPVEVRLKNRFQEIDGQRLPMLKEGMMAEVTFEGTPVDAILVPKDALVRTSRGMILYVFDPDPQNANSGTVRQLTVESGLSDGTEIQVINNKLESGMHVVIEGAERLRPFQTVSVLTDELGAKTADHPGTTTDNPKVR